MYKVEKNMIEQLELLECKYGSNSRNVSVIGYLLNECVELVPLFEWIGDNEDKFNAVVKCVRGDKSQIEQREKLFFIKTIDTNGDKAFIYNTSYGMPTSAMIEPTGNYGVNYETAEKLKAIYGGEIIENNN